MEQQSTIAECDTLIKANLNYDEVKQIVLDLYDIKVILIKELNGYDDRNYHISDGKSEGIILKVINSVDSAKPEIFEAQSLLLVHLDKHGISCPTPIKTKYGEFFKKVSLKSGEHIVRALTFISGEILSKVPWNTDLFYQIGESAAYMDTAMESFEHPAYSNYTSIWMLESVPKILRFLSVVECPQRRKLVTIIVEQFKEKLLSKPNSLARGLIHGDYNEQNIIVEKNNKGYYIIKGIIDYGDCHIGYYLYELAITMTYMMLLDKNIEVGGYVLDGYSSIKPVTDEECSLLKLCISARLCQSLVMGAYTHQKDPTNTYVLVTAAHGWQLLEQLWNTPDEKVLELWKDVAMK